MRILIDASPLLLRSAGVKNYLYYWLRALQAEAGSGHSVRAFPFVNSFGPLEHERSVLPRPATWLRLGLLYGVNLPGSPLLDWMAARAGIVHLTNQVRRPARRAALTATIHDMTAAMMPQLHTAANVRADALFAERVLRRAAGLIAVSESTRADAVRMLRLDERRIEVIYPGVAAGFSQSSRGDAETLARRYGIQRSYALFVGTIEPRKNVDLLLDAWAQLGSSVREEFELVLIGPAGWASQKTMARLARPPGGVRYLGYVPEGDLPALTAAASVFVYPSLYEGFGFPVAQAMAAGVAVITSNVSSLPEIAGDAALLVDPRSTGELRNALERLLGSVSLRERLGAAGRQRAARYCWRECARRSLRFFERVHGGCLLR